MEARLMIGMSPVGCKIPILWISMVGAPMPFCSAAVAAATRRGSKALVATAAPAEILPMSRRVMSGISITPATYQFTAKIRWHRAFVQCIVLNTSISYLDVIHGHGPDPDVRGCSPRTQLQWCGGYVAPLATRHQPTHRAAGARIRHRVVR